jgi:hypothetical protein
MALVQIADVVVPAIFAAYVQDLTVSGSAFYQSGVIEASPLFDAMLAGGGKTFDLPKWDDLNDDDPNVSDDSENSVTPKKIGTSQETAIRCNWNQSWKAADLAGDLAGSDPMDAIAQRVAAYWQRGIQRQLIKSAVGVMADNEANDAGDMLKDIALGVAGTPGAANLFSAEAFIDTVQTMGDQGENLVAVAMHSVVYRRAQKNNLIDFIPDSEGRVSIPTFLGRRVIVDDGLPTATVSGNVEYSTFLFGSGAFAYGSAAPNVPAEVYRLPLQGNGGGTEALISRVQNLIHPRGFRFTSTSLAGASPTFAELATATNWDRVLQRKQVRFAELRSNG